jgi:ABC-type glycerol-3-phosphate transport system substrate-binding protein
MRMTSLSRLTAVSVSAVVILSGCASAEQSTASPDATAKAFQPETQDESSTITVWTDATRLDAVKKFQAANANIKMDIVTYDGSADGSTYLQTKVQLFDRTDKGWPDVVFGSPTDLTWATLPSGPNETPFAAPLDEGLVPQATLDGFAKGSLDPCTFGGHTYCLRNDIAQVVLWYNKKLMDKWGYEVPKTWQDYQSIGEKVGKDHPGYLVGTIGDTNSNESYFWSSQCPANQLVKPDTLLANMQAPNCTRMASLLDTLLKAKSLGTQGFFAQGFDGSKVLMANGPSWYGQYLFKTAFKTPAGQIAATGPLTWNGDPTVATGNVGGGVWMVSAHSKNLKAATALTSWLTTSTDNLANAPTYPAYSPGAKAWLANPANNSYYAADPSSVFQAAADAVWTGWSNTKFSDQTPWSSAVLPALTAGKTLTETLPAWQEAVTNQAKSVGYTVINK